MQVPNMQYNQTFWSPGLNRFDTPAMNNPLSSQVVGEGDVVSMVSPDGIIQYFFTPIYQWLPYVPNPTVKSNYNYFNPNVASWFVRSISNPLPSAVFSHPYQRPSAAPHTSCYSSDCNFNMTNPGFQLKFHNDNWTSTTDLYYFCPGAHQRDWIPRQNKGSAAIQVEMPVLTNTICHCQVICNKPCHCSLNSFHKNCKSDGVHIAHEEAESSMSVDDLKTKPDAKHKQSNKQCRYNRNTHRKCNETQISCECKKTPGTSDKLVTTFADQKTGYTPEIGRETQTIFKNSSFTNTTTLRKGKNNSKRKEIQQEMWYPNTSFAKKIIKSESSKTIAGNSVCCSGATSESCDCNSETD